MTEDARFEDGAERPVSVAAVDTEDLQVVSALVQDAVFGPADIRWEARRRRLVLLLNRFRWEDRAAAERAGRPYERVRALLTVEDVTGVQSQGIDRADKDAVLSLLAVAWDRRDDGTGRVLLTLAGDGAIAANAECLNVTLRDVTRPYRAPSGKVPSHD